MRNSFNFKNDTIKHIDDFKDAYEKEGSGYFFSPDTMRFLSCRILSHSKVIGNSIYFVTSERAIDRERGYTIRRGYINEGGGLSVESISEFQEFETIAKAKAFLENHKETKK